MNCRLLEKKWLYRKFLLETEEGSYCVEYSGRGLGYECVLVNGEAVAGGVSRYWFIPRFQFALGSKVGVLNVRVWPWLTIRSLRIDFEGHEVYVE